MFYTNNLTNVNVFTSFLVSILIICIPTPAIAAYQSTADHPLISRFEGAKTFYHHSFDYIPSHILIAPFDKAASEKSVLRVEGKGSFIKYHFATGAYSFEVMQSFKNKLNTPLFTDVFECERTKKINTCGKDIRAFSSKYNVEKGFQTSCSNQDNFYITSANIIRPDGKNTYVYICIQGSEVNQTIIEEKDFNTNKITVASNYSPKNASLSALRAQTKKDVAGATKKINIQDANLLKIKSYWCYEMKVPIIKDLIYSIISIIPSEEQLACSGLTAINSLLLDVKYMALSSQAIVRMQTPIISDGSNLN